MGRRFVVVQSLMVLLVGSAPWTASAAKPAVSKVQSEGPEVALTKGLKLRAAGHMIRATQTLREAWSAFPKERALGLELAVTLSWRGRLDAALETYTRVLELRSSDVDAALGAARMEMWLGRFSAAEQRLQEVLQREPKNAAAMAALGHVALARLDPDDAKFWFSKALAIEPKHAEAVRGLKGAKSVWRVQVSAGAGVTWVDNQSTAPSARAGVLWRMSPRLNLVAAYTFGANGSVEDSLAQRSQHGVSAGLVWRPSDTVWFNAAALGRFSAERKGGGLQAGVAAKVARQWTLSGSLRGEVNDASEWSVLGRVALNWSHAPLPGAFAVFVSHDHLAATSTAAVLRVSLPQAGPVSVGLGPLFGLRWSGAKTDWSAGALVDVAIRVAPLTRVVLRADALWDGSARANASVQVEQRF